MTTEPRYRPRDGAWHYLQTKADLLQELFQQRIGDFPVPLMVTFESIYHQAFLCTQNPICTDHSTHHFLDPPKRDKPVV